MKKILIDFSTVSTTEIVCTIIVALGLYVAVEMTYKSYKRRKALKKWLNNE